MERCKYLLMQMRAKRKKEAKDNLIKIDLWSIEQCREILLNDLQSFLLFCKSCFSRMIAACSDSRFSIRFWILLEFGIFRKCILTFCHSCFTLLLIKVRKTGKMQKNLECSSESENVVWLWAGYQKRQELNRLWIRKKSLNMCRNSTEQSQNIYGINRQTVQYSDIKTENGMQWSWLLKNQNWD